jgi:hypothetical protein
MTMFAQARATRIAAHREWSFWKSCLLLIIVDVFALAVAPSVESHIDPVLYDQSAENAAQEPDGRLCWDWLYTKRREAVLLGAYAQLYAGDRQTPMSAGLEHEDGTPFGMAGYRDPQDVRTCVRVPPHAWTYYRIGVRPKLIYQDVPFWTVQQDGAWVDWFKSST